MISEDMAIPTTLAVVAAIDPTLGVIATATAGTLTVIDKWKEKRVKEIDKNVGFIILRDLLEKDDKSRDILHRVLRNVFDEQSERKRMLYYQYLKNIHADVLPDFDYHSKIVETINEITFEEIDILRDFSNAYPTIAKYIAEKDANKQEPDFYVFQGANLDQIRYPDLLGKYSDFQLENKLTVLSNKYDLLVARYGRYDGTMFGPLTDFGKAFLDFIDEGKSK